MAPRQCHPPFELLGHAGDLCGGLSQVLPLPPPYDFDEEERGLAAVQLKRALRGAAFLLGGLNNLRREQPNAREELTRLRSELSDIQTAVVDLLQQTRPAPEN